MIPRRGAGRKQDRGFARSALGEGVRHFSGFEGTSRRPSSAIPALTEGARLCLDKSRWRGGVECSEWRWRVNDPPYILGRSRRRQVDDLYYIPFRCMPGSLSVTAREGQGTWIVRVCLCNGRPGMATLVRGAGNVQASRVSQTAHRTQYNSVGA
jgi:hypothetical protein